MKNTLKVVLATALFCSTTFAGDMGAGGFTEGDMGAGGKTAPTTGNICGDMGAGGKTNPCSRSVGKTSDENSIFDFVSAFLASIF